MSLRTLFRVLVVLPPLLAVASLTYHCLAEPGLSEDWRAILAWNGDGGWLPSDSEEPLTFASTIAWLVVGISLVIALLAVQVGLFFFRAWARTANLVLTVVFLITVPFSGLSISLPLEAACYEAVSIADGFLLALAYFSPLRRQFAKKRSV